MLVIVLGTALVSAATAATPGSDSPSRSVRSEPDGDDRIHTLPWRLVGVGAEDLVLQIRVEHGMCTTIEQVHAAETSRSVTVEVVARTRVPPPPRDDGLEFACPDALARRTLEVELNAPLGSRQVRRSAET